MFIRLEGMDCTGKTQAARELKKRLVAEGYKVVHLFEPYEKGADNKAIRNCIINGNYTQNAKAMLALASRIDLYEKRIKPALDDKKIVIVERSFISTMVYQGEDNPDAVLNVHIAAMEEFSAHLDPDLLVHMEITHEEFTARISKRKGAPDKIEKSLADKNKFNQKVEAYRTCIAKALEGTDVELLKENDVDKIYDHIIKEVGNNPAYKV